MVRECRPPAREPGRSWLARRSTMATSTPANASSPASISPVGPPPAITTACSVTESSGRYPHASQYPFLGWHRQALPLASAIQSGGARVADELLSRPRVQELWVLAATRAQRQLERVLDDDTGAVSTENGKIVLDLRPIVIQLGDQVAIIGNIAQKLPADTGRIEIADANRLELAQDVTGLFKAVAAWIWILPFALWAAALWLARGRRRIELRAIAVGAILAGVFVLALRSVAGGYLVDDLTPRESGKPAAQAAWDILTSLLADGAWSLVLLGAVALVGVWLAGSSRSGAWARGQLAPVFARWELTYGIVATGLLLLVWWGPIVQTRRLLYMVVFTALLVAGVEVLRRVVARLPGSSTTTA